MYEVPSDVSQNEANNILGTILIAECSTSVPHCSCPADKRLYPFLAGRRAAMS